MCGICGYISKNRYSEALLSRMNDTMKHRGPNDSGVIQIQSDGLNIGLAHRRLSILDLSPMGHQPMYSKSGEIIIVYNGEIYNYKEIARNLNKSGIELKSNCDTEVILEAYNFYGKKFLTMLNGMFAFVIYDKAKRKIIAARDRMGKKPFYYYYDDEKRCFAFGSTLQPIMLFPETDKKISDYSLYEFMYYGYVTEPKSIFENVSKLEPGHVLELNLDTFELTVDCYWDLYETFKQGRQELLKDYDTAKQVLKESIIKSVNYRMISDVPLGTFLSGGIDSSLISAIAQSLTTNRINTYSIGFEEAKYDESAYAQAVSNYIGTNHHSVIVTEKDLINMADDLVKYYDEPFADSSQLPSMMVSKLAKKDITVALTGDGGDELFCGYESYDNILRVQKYGKIAKIIKPFTNIELINTMLPTRVLSVVNASDKDSCQWISVAQQRIVDSMLINRVTDIRYDEGWMSKLIPVQNRRMLADLKYYLPGDILHKVDRASMKYSLESRCPLLDFDVVSNSFRIPLEYMYLNGEKKYILKDILYDYVPKKLLDRPKKGFSVPLEKILRTERARDIIEKVSEESFIKEQGLFDYEGVHKIIDIALGQSCKVQESYKKNAIRVVWNYYVFQNWYLEYMVKH